MDRIVFLIDMNSYFASVEQAINPALRGKPIVVCGEGRTVVTTASYEARACGVKTGMSLYEARKACPAVIPVRGSMDKYVDTSRRIHDILLAFTDQVEAYSIDECFVDVTSLCRRGRAPKSIALEIKKQIREKLKLTCSIGIGPNKVVAKIASKLQKPDGLIEIRREDLAAVYSKLPVEKLQGVGIGAKTARRLLALGIRTAGDLAAASVDRLRFHFGIIGCYLRSIGRGEDSAPVKTYFAHEQVKSVGHSYTFPRDAWDLSVVKSYLRMLSDKVGVRLREARLEGRTVHLWVRYGDFTGFGQQCGLKRYLKEGYDIYTEAWKIAAQHLPFPQAVRLVGVTVSDLRLDTGQRYLLESFEKQERLSETVDEINKRYGEFTVKPSSLIIAEKFGTSAGCGMVPKKRYTRDRQQ